MSWECKEFTSAFIKKVEPVLLSLGATRFPEQPGVISEEFLYRLSGDVWLSCGYDLRDNYFECRLGRLFTFRDVLPRVIVLGNYEWYAAAAIESGLAACSRKFDASDHRSSIDYIAATLAVVAENYESLSKRTADKLLFEAARLKSYLIEDISDKDVLSELDNLKHSSVYDEINNNVQSRMAAMNADPVLSKIRKRESVKNRIVLSALIISFAFLIATLNDALHFLLPYSLSLFGVAFVGLIAGNLLFSNRAKKYLRASGIEKKECPPCERLEQIHSELEETDFAGLTKLFDEILPKHKIAADYTLNIYCPSYDITFKNRMYEINICFDNDGIEVIVDDELIGESFSLEYSDGTNAELYEKIAARCKAILFP